jgi:hypothetical protein
MKIFKKSSLNTLLKPIQIVPEVAFKALKDDDVEMEEIRLCRITYISENAL